MAPGDYGAVVNEQISFSVGQTNATHRIFIAQDEICEIEPDEYFFSSISLLSGIQPIDVIRPLANITIDDNDEIECGMYSII